MNNNQRHQPSDLFKVRLWAEVVGDGQQEYRGTVQHVVSGEARHFRDWSTLEAFLVEIMNASEERTHLTNRMQED